MKVFVVEFFNSVTFRYLLCGIFDNRKDALQAIEILIKEEMDFYIDDCPWMKLDDCREHYQVSEYELGKIKNKEWEIWGNDRIV